MPTQLWEPLARVALQAAYEGTLCAALNAMHRHKGEGGSDRVFLTLVGGGVFGNPMHWICDAMHNALLKVKDAGLKVFVVVYKDPAPLELTNILSRLRHV